MRLTAALCMCVMVSQLLAGEPAPKAAGTAGASGDAAASGVSVLTCKFSQPSCRPGLGVDITFRWDAKPMDKKYLAFVHISSADNKTKFQADHEPSPPTTEWNGKIENTHTVVVPTDAPPGEYRVEIGLYDKVGKKRSVLAKAWSTSSAASSFKSGRLRLIPKRRSRRCPRQR